MIKPDSQGLYLPITPSAEEIRYQRWVVGGLTKEEAADLCDVAKSTWYRWESGSGEMSRTAWAWFRLMTSGGDLSSMHKDWEGWSSFRGRLKSPGGDKFTAGQILAIPYMQQCIASYKDEATKLRSEISELENRLERLLDGGIARDAQKYEKLKALVDELENDEAIAARATDEANSKSYLNA